LRIANCELRTANCELRTMSYASSRTTHYASRFTHHDTSFANMTFAASWFRKVAVIRIYATISSEEKEERPAADMSYRQRATNG